jgi:hypothetical protein
VDKNPLVSNYSSDRFSYFPFSALDGYKTQPKIFLELSDSQETKKLLSNPPDSQKSLKERIPSQATPQLVSLLSSRGGHAQLFLSPQRQSFLKSATSSPQLESFTSAVFGLFLAAE